MPPLHLPAVTLRTLRRPKVVTPHPRDRGSPGRGCNTGYRRGDAARQHACHGSLPGATVNYDDSDGTGAVEDAMLATAEGDAAMAECPFPEAGAPAAEGEAAAPAEGETQPTEAAAPAEGEEAAAPAEGEAEAAASAEGEGEESAAGGGAAASDPAAIEAGQALFVGQLGCYGCHGQDGGGGMGPALNDATWIYRGDEASVTESVTNGRPGGMSAFGE